MMKFYIKINKDLSTAKKILAGWQYAIYKIQVNGLLSMINIPLGKYKINTVKDSIVYMDEGDEEYIKKQYKMVEDFLLGDGEELNKDNYKQYQKYKNNRFVAKILRMSLDDGTVLGFFNKLGIMITWYTEE